MFVLYFIKRWNLLKQMEKKNFRTAHIAHVRARARVNVCVYQGVYFILLHIYTIFQAGRRRAGEYVKILLFFLPRFSLLRTFQGSHWVSC